MKKSKKSLILGIAILAVLACVVAVVFILTGKLGNKSGYTVKFELCTELQTTTVLDRTVAPGSFLEEPEVYVTEENEENWEIVGWYREPEYEIQWDFDFDTVDSDITLYAKWAVNPQCTINFYTEESEKPVVTKIIKKGLEATPCDEEFVGREVLGYYSDRAMTKEFDFDTKIQEDTDIFVELSEYVYFNAKMISKWNVCGNQSEIDAYEVSTSLSKDEEIFTVSSKNGGWLWLNNLKLAMNGTSIIQIKAREVNDNNSGVIGGYVLGSYTVNEEPGASTDFGQPNTGSMSFGKSAKPDEDGFYTYTYNISNLTPGLVYTELGGIRIDFYGEDKYTYEIKEIKTFVDEYAVSGEAFSAKGLDFTGLHINTFSVMAEAEIKMLENGDLRFGGPNGAYIFKRDLNITLGDEQIIRLKAKGDLKGGQVAMFFYGEYTQDGKKGVTTDFSEAQKITFVAGETDSKGYTVYTADLSTLGLKVDVLHGLRLDLWGDGTRSIDIQSLKSYAPTKEEIETEKGFRVNGLDLKGSHLATFIRMGDAEGTLLSNGDYKFAGPNGVYIYRGDIEITLADEQIIRLKAKGDLKGGQVAMFFYGEYTQDGKAGVTTDFSEAQKITFVAGDTDAEGYTTYTADLSTLGFKVDVLHGLRLDLWGDGSRSIEIQSLKSYAPTKEEIETEQGFKANGLDLQGSHLTTFIKMGDADGTLLSNGDYKFAGPNGVYIYRKDVEITLGDEQIIRLKAKGDLKGGQVAMFFYGEYTQDGQAGVTTDFSEAQKIIFIADAPDAEGYTTYTADLSTLGLKVDVLHGLRLDLWGDGTRSIEIQSWKSYAPSKEEIEMEQGFKGNGLNLKGSHFTTFLKEAGAEGKLLSNGDYNFGGPNGAYIYRENMEITLADDQIIEMKAKGDLKGGAAAMFFYGEYTKDGQPGVTTGFTGEQSITFVAGDTDAEGYTTYTADLSTLGLKVDVLHGLRLDLWGGGTRNLEILSLKSRALSEMTVTYYVEDTCVYTETVKEGEKVLQPADNLIAMGHKVLGYYSDAECTSAYQFGNSVKEDTDIYVKLSDYLYFSPAMLKEFDVAAGTAGSATAVTEIVDDALKFEAVDGSYINKKDMNLDVSNTQVIEFVANATVDVSGIDIWLLGTYTKDGQSYTNTAEDVNLRWRITPDTTGEYVTYRLDLSESSKISGMVWEEITGIKIDMLLHNTDNTGIINIQSIKATQATNVLEENFDGEANWTYTDASGNPGTVTAQGQEEMGPKAVYAYRDGFDNGADSYTQVSGTGSHTVETQGENKVLKITSDTTSWYTLGTSVDGIPVKSGETYKLSFKVKSVEASKALCFVLFAQSWDAGGISWAKSGEVVVNVTANSSEWTEVAMEYTVPANHVNVQLHIQERWSTAYYVDDIAICYEEQNTIEREEIAYQDEFDNGADSYAQVSGTGSHTVETQGENKVLKITSDTSSWYTLGTSVDGIPVKSGETYKLSFKVKSVEASKALCFVLFAQSWDAGGISWAKSGEVVVNVTANSSEWTEVAMEYTVPANHVNVQLHIQERWSTAYYVDDIKISYLTTEVGTTYTQGIGTCITSGVAAEADNVLYVKDYTSVETSAEIKAGNTYKYTFLMRNDATGSDFDFDVHVGGMKVADVASGTLTESTWTEVSGTFTATANATTFGFLRAGEGGVYIDDVVLVKMGAAEGGEGGSGNEQPENTTGLVSYGNFENTNYDYTSDWRVQGSSGQMAVVEDPDNADNTVLQFTATDEVSGVDFNGGDRMGVLQQGKTYTISFKYKGDAQFHIFTLGLTSAEHVLHDDWVPKSADGWTTYTCEITPSIDTTTTSMQFYLKMATATGGTFYVDDFSILEKVQ